MQNDQNNLPVLVKNKPAVIQHNPALIPAESVDNLLKTAIMRPFDGVPISATTTKEMRDLAIAARRNSLADGKGELRHYPLKTLEILSEIDDEKQALFESAQVMLSKMIALKIKTYFRGVSSKDEQEFIFLQTETANVVVKYFSALSIYEIDYAFEWALVKNAEKYEAYGANSLQLIVKILKDYKKSHGAFSLAMQEAEEAYFQEQNKAQIIAANNEKAYSEMVEFWQELRKKNTIYKCWSQCPHVFVERMAKEGTLQVSAETKSRLHAQAKSLAAAYIFKGISSTEHREKAQQFFAEKKLGFLQFYTQLPEVYKEHKAKDAGEKFAEVWDKTVMQFYCKMLFMQSIGEHQNVNSSKKKSLSGLVQDLFNL